MSLISNEDGNIDPMKSFIAFLHGVVKNRVYLTPTYLVKK